VSRWVRMDCGIFEHELFAREPMTEREAWLWLVVRAAWKDTRHRIGLQAHPVARGSLFVTLRELQEAWGWRSDFRVRSFLEMLETEAMIKRDVNAGKTLITVCNYNKYQDVGGGDQRTENAPETQPQRTENALKIPEHQVTKEGGGVSASEREPSESLKTRQAICEVYAKADALPPDTSRTVVWLERGYSHDEIVAAIAGVVKPGNTPSSLAYFDKPLERMRSIPNAPPRVAGAPSRGPPQHRKGSAGMSDALDRIFPDDPNNQAIPSSPVRLLSGAG